MSTKLLYNPLEIGAKAPYSVTDKLSDYYAELCKKRDDFIKSKIEERGLGHLIPGLESRTFPKIACIKHEGWSYYYADDDTPDGKFIVAVQEADFVQSQEENSFKLVGSFKWQDNQPLQKHNHHG